MLALLPLCAHRRIAADPELDHEAVDGAEEARVVEEAGLDEVVEAVGPVGRPVAVDLDDEVALGRRELGLEDVRRLGVRLGRIEQVRVDGRREGPAGRSAAAAAVVASRAGLRRRRAEALLLFDVGSSFLAQATSASDAQQ